MEFVHDFGSDDAGGDFGKVVFVEFGEDLFHGTVEPIHRDRSFLARFDETPKEFFAIERFAAAVLLHDTQLGALDLLVGGVAITTVEALAAASNRRAILGHPRVDDFVFVGTAWNAPHQKRALVRMLCRMHVCLLYTSPSPRDS